MSKFFSTRLVSPIQLVSLFARKLTFLKQLFFSRNDFHFVTQGFLEKNAWILTIAQGQVHDSPV